MSTYPGLAWAQSSPSQTDASPTWEVSIGGGAAGQPVFPGAARYRTEPIFLGSLAYRGLAYLGPAGLGSSEIFSPGFHFGPVVDFSGGRNETSDAHLQGLGNITPTIAAGAIGLWRFEGFELIGIVRQSVIHTNYGLVGRVQADRRITLIPGKLTLLAGPEADFGNGRYMRTWFGVSQEQAADSGLPAYTPVGGVADAGLLLNLDYRYSEHILVRAFGEFRWLYGDAARSPIVQNNFQATFGVGVAYSFDLNDILGILPTWLSPRLPR
jgi:outer membrane scaffolding protein for murein synthesis (MipA/OmpV family)